MAYKIKSRIWIEVDNTTFLGEGRVRLLKSIKETKSLSKSARELGISYKKAWNLIDSVNKKADMPVVVRKSGGSGGGGTTLTEHGLELIEMYDTININCWKYLDKQLKKYSLD
ncbi:winged helix-turn-helix domain-containing protein [Tenacibaculum singaporense]|uniref:winged helix-turn-helix domain-containing protein n=1 Tax=Tenacibaculum singaporense TaxID=2358479 RepID=UPI000F668689|nr:LysR family transcriptional regulator [Tenacibaculum singaporense]RSC92843.1 LysR family transcriptional regulator [Tenacibaculum singaporense]